MPDNSSTIAVWLVEDHKSYGERLQRELNRIEGLECPRRFTTCEAALAALPGSPAPRVILLDVELPGISGIEAISRFRALARDTALIILTVFEDDEKISRAICAGASGYLLKAAGLEEIASAIRSAAAGGSPINPSIARRVLDMFSQANAPRRDYKFSPREKETLRLLVEGSTIKGVAADLGVSFYTADQYIRGVYEKLQVHSRGSAVAKAVKERLL